MIPAEPRGVVEAVVRALRVMDVLWDHAAYGLSSSEVAEAAREGRSYTTRALQTLEAAGYVTRWPETGRWAPSVRVAQRATRLHRALGQAGKRIEELQARVGRLAETTGTGGDDE
jgi:DNA-binding IclR family transcriptional regulator